MIPTCTCPRCHGERIDPSTRHLPDAEKQECRRCGEWGELPVPRYHEVRVMVEGERTIRRMEAA